MMKYKTGNQTFVILGPTERQGLTDMLEAAENWLNQNASRPKDWDSVLDGDIFRGMLYLNGTLGYQSNLLPAAFPCLGTDPTTDQFKQLNMAIGKMTKYWGTIPGVSRFVHSTAKGTFTSQMMTTRMNARRAALWTFVQTNVTPLRNIQAQDNRLVANLCHNPVCAADRTLHQNIRNLLVTPVSTGHSDLGELFA